MRNKFLIKLFLFFLILFQIQSTSAFGKIYAIKNATIVTVTNGIIENGIIILENDKISAIGKNITIPSSAEVIDATGLFVYPGLIDAGSNLGLTEIGAVTPTNDYSEMGSYNPHIQATVAVNPHSVHIPITRVNGITSALILPGGGVISGQCAVLNLNGWTTDEMVVKDPVGICVNFTHVPTKEELERRQTRPGQQQPSSSAIERAEKQIKELKEVFFKAKRYAANWRRYKTSNKPPAPDQDLMLAALVPVVQKELPVIISVNTENDIKNAIKFGEELDIKMVFRGVVEGWKVAKLINENNIPVLVGPILRTPGSKDPYDAPFANAAILNKAGVKIAFLTGGAADARNLPYHSGTAAAFGLPKGEALKAVTINPAEILGVSDKIGSLEVGKLTNVIITDGDPLEMRTQVIHVFIAGEKINLKSKHTELYNKFKNRPKK